MSSESELGGIDDSAHLIDHFEGNDRRHASSTVKFEESIIVSQHSDPLKIMAILISCCGLQLGPDHRVITL